MPNEPAVTASGNSIFSYYELSRLEQIQRFLINIAQPSIARVAARVGYDAKEHSSGWKLWTTSAGVNVPFDYHLSEAEQRLHDGDVDVRDRIHVLDVFENTWFPRARNAIRRFVSPEHRDTVETAFFADMTQQPEGPLVVGSVEKLLGRIESLRTSKVKGASDAYDSLVKKGLTRTKIKTIQTVIDECKTHAGQPSRPRVKHEEIAATAAERRTAYDELNLWYIDWAEALRCELSYKDALRLGIVSAKTGAKASANESESPQDASDSPAKPTSTP